MSLLRKPYSYSRVEKEDPEEVKHRQAQFLIYKVMEQADFSSSSRRRRRRAAFSCLRVGICKLKMIRIGRRLRMRLRKGMSSTISAARAWKRFFHGGQAIISLPPAFKR
ncbi:uncharacterized protein LOC127808663 [Diospyros lotus]|uniref:uncharacterized protein LOC127808663 n=1 Tax=Diospyros lotus TaxID=55363 RepID=UPI002256216C|nr:uncharacterized protein LOC127808663 [Diospyros lotus]